MILPTIREFITECDNEEFETFYQDFVWDVHNDAITSSVNAIPSRIWSLRDITSVDLEVCAMCSDLRSTLI